MKPIEWIELIGTILGVIGNLLFNIPLSPNIALVSILYAISAAIIAYVCYRKGLKYMTLLMLFYTISSGYGAIRFL